jgi:excisionase family DNA binding protein
MENPFDLLFEKLDRIEKAIQKLNLKNSVVPADQSMNISEVANYIKAAKSTIYGLTHKNTIPYYKLGKKLYFKKSEIDEWINSKKRKTKNDIEDAANEYMSKNPR